jgi:hypothetical protein
MATQIVADRAILNALLALAYYLRGAPLPPACFPGSHETIELLGRGDPNPLAPEAPLRRWISEHEPTPWRSRCSSLDFVGLTASLSATLRWNATFAYKLELQPLVWSPAALTPETLAGCLATDA